VISASCDSFGFAKIRGRARWSGLKSLVDIIDGGAVAELVGIEGGVVSGVINLESSGVEAVGLETTP
jgi:hypothetical protein